MRKTKFSIIVVALSLVVLAVSAIPVTVQLGLWRDVNPTAYINPAANPALNSVFMLSVDEGWAVGDSQPTTNTTTALPAILHYDGATWNLVPAPKFPDFPSNPSAYNLTSVSFGPPDNPISRSDGWAVGFNSSFLIGAKSPNATALHWDGTTWRVQIAGLSGTSAGALWSVFMVSPTDAWAVGQNVTKNGGTFWHWTGVPGLGGGWNLVQPPVANIPYSIFMVSATEGWAVGSSGAIWHYFGGAWTAFSTPTSTNLRSVYMLSSTDGWAVGDNGVILHYTGGIWSGPVSPGTTTNNLLSVFMVSGTEGWASGTKGTLLQYSGGAWTVLAPNFVPISPVSFFNLNSVSFRTSADGWGVGTDGVVLHFDGSNWGTVTSPTINNFTSVSFGPPLTGPISPSDGWAVGNASTPPIEPTLYHWNGFMWTKGVAIGTSNNLNSVFMVNGGDVWTVGGGSQATATCAAVPCPVILHFTGGTWNTLSPPAGSYLLKSVFMVSSSEGWAVGEQVGSPRATGIILHYIVSGGVGTWGIYPSPSSPSPVPPLNSVFMLQANEGWAVGDNATILHYTVTGGIGTWNVVPISGTPTLSADANLTSVFMLSATSGWTVGGIRAQGSLSAGPVILYWDGSKWTPVATPTLPGGISSTGLTSATLKSVYFTGPSDGWTVGFPGKLVATIFHWDGIGWNQITTSPALLGQIPPILSSVYMTSPNNGWVVGSDPGFTTISTKALSTILRFSPFGGSAATVVTSTSTSLVASTISTSTTVIATSVSTFVSVTSTTQISTITVTSSVVGGGIPGFPVESVIAGLAIGILAMIVLRRRKNLP
jgi:hypothetical protein